MYRLVDRHVRRFVERVVQSSHGRHRTVAAAADHSDEQIREMKAQDESQLVITEGGSQFSGSGQLSFTEVRVSQNEYVRTASRRVREARASLQEVTAPISPADTSTLLERQRKLEWVFEQCWSLVESAKLDGASTSDVEALLNSSFDVRLAHDLGNLAKHRKLTRQTKTGKRPLFGKPEMVTIVGPDAVAVTEFELEVFLDSVSQGQGADVARLALDAWEIALNGWGIG